MFVKTFFNFLNLLQLHCFGTQLFGLFLKMSYADGKCRYKLCHIVHKNGIFLVIIVFLHALHVVKDPNGRTCADIAAKLLQFYMDFSKNQGRIQDFPLGGGANPRWRGADKVAVRK